MNREQRRAQARSGNAEIRKVNREKGYGPVLREVPLDQIDALKPEGMTGVWRSERFLVQVFAPPKNSTDVVLCRLSVNLTMLGKGGRWEDGIAWDELQEVKRQCGYGEHDAVEVYPHDADVVNVANMRHLWILTGPLPFAWRSDDSRSY